MANKFPFLIPLKPNAVYYVEMSNSRVSILKQAQIKLKNQLLCNASFLRKSLFKTEYSLVKY